VLHPTALQRTGQLGHRHGAEWIAWQTADACGFAQEDGAIKMMNPFGQFDGVGWVQGLTRALRGLQDAIGVLPVEFGVRGGVATGTDRAADTIAVPPDSCVAFMVRTFRPRPARVGVGPRDNVSPNWRINVVHCVDPSWSDGRVLG
jgi:hypothetical protein